MIKNKVMNRKVVIFSLVVVLIGFLCIINSHYLVWSIGGWSGEFDGFLMFLFFSSLFIMVYLCLGMFCLHESNSWTEKIKKKGRGHFKRLEAKLNLSLKQIFACDIVYCIVAIVLNSYFTNRFLDSVAYGNCLYRCHYHWGKHVYITSLYTKDGRAIVNKVGRLGDFTAHEDLDMSDSYYYPIEGAYSESCVMICPGGPYFCFLKKVDIDLEDKGRGYDYDKKVYYQYEGCEITYWVSIYNSEGIYVDDFEEDYRFYHYPDKKKIDGDEYSYSINGEDFEWLSELTEKLGEMVHEGLEYYVSHMNDEKQPSSKNEHVHEAKPQTTPQTTTSQAKPKPATSQPKPQPVPMQVFKKCMSCLGGGQCSPCYGSGVIHYPTGQQFCPVCGGTGRCNICAGRGGEYVVEYH